MIPWRNPAVVAALAAAALFGIGTPVAKLLLGPVSPWLLAGLLYAGSGIGLFALRRVRQRPPARLQPGETKWLLGAIIAGGIAGPVFLMWGLARLPASNASLLLNAEGVLTALIAWFVFRENFDRRIAIGMALIVAGAAVLSWPHHVESGSGIASIAVLAACLCWAIDNNLTRKVALTDASFIAMVKGLVAGAVNIGIALAINSPMPSAFVALAAGTVGFLSYGLSLMLFVIALRGLGTARTAAYFSTAPFLGALISIPVLNENITTTLLAAGALMATGVWLHLTESHAHAHTHQPIEHEHEHTHDAHHQHEHAGALASAPGIAHAHRHVHSRATHTHAHFPDAHHRHDHQH